MSHKSWTQHQIEHAPTMSQMEIALVKAGINPDCSQWSREDMMRAETILNCLPLRNVRS